ncbi:MAG: metallophosphoesterase [Thermodesulfobacteriota bacterium]|jgi:GTPase SAR1 family protein/UDP-2,3-diacylglucosamine pyrophosphatase LpxH
MKVLLIHLSDIHFEAKSNAILFNIKPLLDSFQNLSLDCDVIFVVVTGDIAFSGLDIQYSQANILLKELSDTINTYSHKKPHFVLIPGNHDCNYKTKVSDRDSTLVDILKNNKVDNISSIIIDQCCKVQKSFFDFSSNYKSGNILFSNHLINIIEYKFNNYTIIFNCYNTAWLSQINEKETYFPIEAYEDSLFTRKADLIISVLHHSYSWFKYLNMRQFAKHIENTSDLVLTGHEHISSKFLKTDLEGAYVVIVEGSILQYPSSLLPKTKSHPLGFNIICFDLKDPRYRIHNFHWKRDYFSCINNPLWKPLTRSLSLKKSEFRISDSFSQYLNDADAGYTHPNVKDEIYLDDLFVFPNLRDLEFKKKGNKDILSDIIDSQKLLDVGGDGSKMLLIGGEKTGKTALCKSLFRRYFGEGIVPVKIDGSEIKTHLRDDFEDLLYSSFSEQYSPESYEKFTQLENSKKVIIIDDFHHSRLNLKYKALFLFEINSLYVNILITVNELFRFQELFVDEEKNRQALESYHKYSIMKFGNLLRSKLVEKWNLLGDQTLMDETALSEKNEQAIRVIDAIIGRNLVPSYPFYLLLILQALESAKPHALRESAFAYYYDMLIVKSLDQIKIKTAPSVPIMMRHQPL